MKSSDVFVTFRGIDTRRTFVSHLLLSLSKEGISTFKQEEQVPWNQPASSQVLQAIQESRIAIVVISKNYSASVSCLDELAMIMECEEKQSLMVIPVLYEVDPSDVLRQADNLGDHGDGGNKNLEKVKRWRDTLAKAIRIYRQDYSYWEDKDSYSYIIDEVMIHVASCLSESDTLSKPDHALGEAMVAIDASCTISDAVRGSKTKYSNLKLPKLVQLTPIGLVTMGIALLAAILRIYYGRFMDVEMPMSVSPWPARKLGNSKLACPIPWPAVNFMDIQMNTSSPWPAENFMDEEMITSSPWENFMDEEMITPSPWPAENFVKEERLDSFDKFCSADGIEVSDHISHVSDHTSHVSDSIAYPMTLAYPSLRMLILLMFISSGLATMGFVLVRAALGTIVGRFIDGKKPISLRPRPAGSFVGVQKEKYATGNKLSRLFFSNDSSSLVGMDRHTKAVNTLLDLHFKGVKEIGIWGVRGVGKTTLARCVYEQISPQFQDHYYFMKDTKIFSLGRYSTCLLEEITRAALMPTSESEWKSLYEVVKAKLGHRKVLLIVDDLLDSSHLKNIRTFFRWFGPGSRLILVGHDIDILVQCEVKHLYEVESLRYDEALQLLSQFAFKQSHVPRGFERLSVRAVLITGRIPLALKVFGSFLCGKCTRDWESELCRLEASQDICVARVSSYIGDGFS